MLTFPRKAARRTLIAVAVLTVSAVWCAPALGQSIVIQPPGGAQVIVEFDDVVGTVGPTSYPLRSRRDGQVRRVPIPDGGASLKEVLRAAGQPRLLTDYDYIDIPRNGSVGECGMPGSNCMRVSRRQINTGHNPPAVWVDASGKLNLLRASTGPNDVNAKDWVISSGDITLAQEESSGLRVHLDCTRKAVKAGEKVKCTAKASGGGLGDDYWFEWDFGDGKTYTDHVKVNESTVEHKYAKGDTYSVDVAVFTNGRRGDDGAPNRAADVKVEDDAAQEDATDDTTSGTTGGAYTGTGGTTGSYGSTSTPTTPSAPSTSTPSTPTPTPTPPATSFGDTIEGNLLADISSSSPATASAARAAKSGTATFEPPDDTGGVVPAAVWAGLGALLLMTAGAGLESGHRPRLRLPHLPRILRR